MTEEKKDKRSLIVGRVKCVKEKVGTGNTSLRNMTTETGKRRRAYELYLEIADRFTDEHGKGVPNSCRKHFLRITTSDTERFIADVVFSVTEDQHCVCSRKYMMDSGSTFHLICWKHLREQEKQNIRNCRPCMLNTANGKVKVDKEVDIYIYELDLTLTAYILDDSLPILSVGRLCRMH